MTLKTNGTTWWTQDQNTSIVCWSALASQGYKKHHLGVSLLLFSFLKSWLVQKTFLMKPWSAARPFSKTQSHPKMAASSSSEKHLLRKTLMRLYMRLSTSSSSKRSTCALGLCFRRALWSLCKSRPGRPHLLCHCKQISFSKQDTISAMFVLTYLRSKEHIRHPHVGLLLSCPCDIPSINKGVHGMLLWTVLRRAKRCNCTCKAPCIKLPSKAFQL
jgi:hypothetical protein